MLQLVEMQIVGHDLGLKNSNSKYSTVQLQCNCILLSNSISGGNLNGEKLLNILKSPIKNDSDPFSHQSCLKLCNPMKHSTPGLPVHQQSTEFTQTHVHRVSDAI